MDIAFFCANHMTRVFSWDPHRTIFLSDQHEGWQSRLEGSIERVLLRARLEDSVAVGTLVLMEKFRDSAWPKRPYPEDVYILHFMVAYALAHRALSRIRRPLREGFWADVFADIISPQQIQSATTTFVRALNYDTNINRSHFVEMRSRMYSFIRTHMAMRSGERYERSRDVVLPASLPEVFDLPPCCEEIVRRKCKSELCCSGNDSDGDKLAAENMHVRLIKIPDRRSWDALFGSSFTIIA
jgi:hypothetical protein